jgi:hypothetical protein
MTPAKILSFMETLTGCFDKTGVASELREGLANRLRGLFKVPPSTKTNLGNWGHGITAMPADYQSSSDAPPM